jgi:glycine oxidase
MPGQPGLVVVGGGVIGLSCAWRAAAAGTSVTLVDPAPGSGASWVAGGMLAPVTEAWPGEEALLELGLESLARWPGFAAELTDAAGADAGLRREGTVVAARSAGDRDELRDLAGHLSRLGREVEVLTGRELRRLEPSIGPDVRGGLSVPGDLAVDNRALLAALRAAAERAGVRLRPAEAREVGEAGLVELADGTTLRGDEVLLAAGAYSGRLYPPLAAVIRPIKGEILRLAWRPGAVRPPRRTVRGLVDGRGVYAVPLPGDRLVVGATQAEIGFETAVTAGGLRDLLHDAERVLPGIAEYAVVESAAGLRPGSPDNVPLVGRVADGLLVATGHHRNGLLLAPLTAEAVMDLITEPRRPSTPGLAAADPARFAPARR